MEDNKKMMATHRSFRIPKAHENIDNEIALETLTRIMQNSSGNYFQSLYEA